ncbi:unnamed protein product [Brachionus calyciflorus]|uniref:Coilin n=1 Tax=Brachionus calyciflorus TaxID=104777 RepID=A0A813Z428_9BILA|nr:unnamed protein product [Brachionus calyciflorus]
MRSDQVRIKLHIAKPGETTVQNLWMCLNYDKKPTIEHITEHIHLTYIQEEREKYSIKLFLDDYWLPPKENSTILRENDVVKVEIKQIEENKNEKTEKLEKSVSKKLEEPQKLAPEYSVYDQNLYYQQAQPVYYLNNVDYGNYNLSEYYKAIENKVDKPKDKLEKNKNSTSKSSLNSTEQNTSVDSKDNQKKSQKLQANTQVKPKQVQNKTKVNNNCYKKFAIGSYVHLLNENVQKPERDLENMSEEQIIDDYYQTIQKQKTSDQKLSSEPVNINKIADNLKATGTAKWKNSSKPTQTKTPTHIRFSSSSSSSSDSSSSEDEETKVEPKKMAEKNNRLYEPSKEQQLNAVSNNKSVVIQNPKDLDKFNKVYNQSKLNAPKAENFIDEILSEGQKPSSSKTTPKSSPRKEQRRSPSPKIDYEKFEALNTAPRVGDKIAFKILEISSNFTPEISGYKNGEVLEFDQNTNEVTLKLYSKFNSVLKRSSKFSVVFDETEDEMTRLKKNENQPEQDGNLEDFEEPELLKVDWRNLINVKLLPKNGASN